MFSPDGLTGARGRRNIDDVIDAKAALADIANALATKFEHGGTDAVSRLAAIHVAAIERWAPVGSSYRNMLSKVDPFDARDPWLNPSQPRQPRAQTPIAFEGQERGFLRRKSVG